MRSLAHAAYHSQRYGLAFRPKSCFVGERPAQHVVLCGVLTVTDPAKFHDTFTRGIGSAKAFGFGLLVIAPIA
jgi:CRISPR-associated protein Cas6/Cse3/CasE subtype I-E